MSELEKYSHHERLLEDKHSRNFFKAVSGLLLAGCCLSTAAAGVLATSRPSSGQIGEMRFYLGPSGQLIHGNTTKDLGIHFSYNNPADPTFSTFDMHIGPNIRGVAVHGHVVINRNRVVNPGHNEFEWEWGDNFYLP